MTAICDSNQAGQQQLFRPAGSSFCQMDVIPFFSQVQPFNFIMKLADQRAKQGTVNIMQPD